MKFFEDDPTRNKFNEFLKNSNFAWIFAISLATVIFIVVLILFIVALVKDKKGYPGVPKAVNKNDADLKEKTKIILDALGGKENILSHSLNGSRITLTLKDNSLVIENILNKAGINSIIKMSNKIILVVKNRADLLYKQLFL